MSTITASVSKYLPYLVCSEGNKCLDISYEASDAYKFEQGLVFSNFKDKYHFPTDPLLLILKIF